MAYVLEVGFHASNRSFPFDSKESADKALAELQPKIGSRSYGDNGERLKSHSFETPAGTVVLDLEKMVAVIDTDARARLLLDDNLRAEEHAIDYEVRRRRALIAVQPPV